MQTNGISRRVYLCVLLLFGALSIHAQNAPPSQLDDTARRNIVQAAAEALRQGYIFPDLGKRAAEAIETALSAGRYDQTQNPEEFAQQLTADLQNVTRDKHMRVTTPNSPPPTNSDGTPYVPPRSEWGVVRADLLAGNIGYIEVVAFPDVAVFQPTVDRAMAALAKTRALIIDVRRHGGGGAEAEVYLASYFVKGKKPVAVNKFIARNRGTDTFRSQEFFSSATPFSYAGKPVYVLTSSNTFSGGEAIAYDLQALKLATLVGEQTKGGANPGGPVPLGFGFAVVVPWGRGENPTTRANWEGVGVTPDVRTSAADALKVALQKLGRSPERTDISDLSKGQVFAPKTTPEPGSEAAVRKLSEGLASGEPPYALMTERLAEGIRQNPTAFQQNFKALGPIKAIQFREIGPNGADSFDVTYQNGSISWGIGLDKDGKIATFGMRLHAPTRD
jgi:hypothetical protein